jgi:hypothetical protein
MSNNMKQIYNGLKELYTNNLHAKETLRDLRIEKGMSEQEANEKYEKEVLDIETKLDTIDIFMVHILHELGYHNLTKHHIDQYFEDNILKLKSWNINDLK